MTEKIYWAKEPSWKVRPVKDYTVFFEHLSSLIPEGSVLFLEGTSMSQDIKDFLGSVAIEEPKDVQVGEARDPDKLPQERTYKVPILGWELRCNPRPHHFHIPATHGNFLEISKMSEHHAEPEMFDHLIIYRGKIGLLSWYDAPTDPFYVSTEISEVSLKEFCAKVQVSYKLES